MVKSRNKDKRSARDAPFQSWQEAYALVLCTIGDYEDYHKIHRTEDFTKKEKEDMRYGWIDEYLQSKAGAAKDIQKDWYWIRYMIGGKIFAAVCLGENDEPYYITLKLEPSEGAFLRQQYADIIPGYYMNKVHWNSIKADGEVPDDLLKDLLDKSYQLVFNKLGKKKQREIMKECQKDR